MKHVAVHWFVQVFKNNILQGSVATPFTCSAKFNDSFVAIFSRLYQFGKKYDK